MKLGAGLGHGGDTSEMDEKIDNSCLNTSFSCGNMKYIQVWMAYTDGQGCDATPQCGGGHTTASPKSSSTSSVPKDLQRIIGGITNAASPGCRFGKSEVLV